MKKNEIGGAYSAYGEVERRKQGFGEKPEGKRQLGRIGRRWEDNIKMDIQEVGCGDMDWIELLQGWGRWRELVNAVMKFWVQ